MGEIIGKVGRTYHTVCAPFRRLLLPHQMPSSGQAEQGSSEQSVYRRPVRWSQGQHIRQQKICMPWNSYRSDVRCPLDPLQRMAMEPGNSSKTSGMSSRSIWHSLLLAKSPPEVTTPPPGLFMTCEQRPRLGDVRSHP